MALRGYKGKRLYSAFSRGALEIKGMFWMQGPQPVGTTGGVPENIGKLFDADPNLQHVSLEWETDDGPRGVVYSRMKE